MRISAWIAMAAILFVMLFSVIYISQHMDHECTGGECPVCAIMEQCGKNVNNIGTIIAALVTSFFLCLSIQKSMQYVIFAYCEDSLISQKVRLNI